MKWGAMKVHRRRRLTLIALVLLAVGSTIGLTLRALNAREASYLFDPNPDVHALRF